MRYRRRLCCRVNVDVVNQAREETGGLWSSQSWVVDLITPVGPSTSTRLSSFSSWPATSVLRCRRFAAGVQIKACRLLSRILQLLSRECRAREIAWSLSPHLPTISQISPRWNVESRDSTSSYRQLWALANGPYLFSQIAWTQMCPGLVCLLAATADPLVGI